MIHPLADVQSTNIGPNTLVWQYSIILAGAVIGDNCNINCHTFIENDVIVGNGVTVKSGVYLWDGITIENYVFIGPNATFTNDKYPRSKVYVESFERILVKTKASIGAAATILGGVTIGAYSMIGAGATVTKNVPDRALVIGSPARVVAYLNEDGSKMKQLDAESYQDAEGAVWTRKSDEIIKQ